MKKIGEKVYWRSRGMFWIKNEDKPQYLYYTGKIVDIEPGKYYVVDMGNGKIGRADFDLLTNGFGGKAIPYDVLVTGEIIARGE